MEFAIGLRKWVVLRVSSLSPAGESMKSSFTSMIVSSSDEIFTQRKSRTELASMNGRVLGNLTSILVAQEGRIVKVLNPKVPFP
jgi:hypothetical protein